MSDYEKYVTIKAKDLEQFGLEVTFENQKTIFDILNQIKVYVNDERVSFDQQPIIVNDRTLVPLRAIFEALGATVEWNDATKTVTATSDHGSVELQIGSDTAKINNPAASSRATIGSRRSVTGPFALNCRTTINVAAGAVADAIAPKTIAASIGR